MSFWPHGFLQEFLLSFFSGHISEINPVDPFQIPSGVSVGLLQKLHGLFLVPTGINIPSRTHSGLYPGNHFEIPPEVLVLI